MNRNFSKEDTQMAKKHIKLCLTLLNSMEMQIKTTVRYHFISTRKAIIQKKQVVGKDMEKNYNC